MAAAPAAAASGLSLRPPLMAYSQGSLPDRLNGVKDCWEGANRGIPIDQSLVAGPRALDREGTMEATLATWMFHSKKVWTWCTFSARSS